MPFIEELSRESEETVHLGVFDGSQRVVLPLIQPGLAAVAILCFMFVWNDFLIGAGLTSREEMRTVKMGLVRFIQDTVGVFWGPFMAFAMLAILPVLIAFFILQKRFVEGLTAGGIKG